MIHTPVSPSPAPRRRFTARTADGLALAVQEWGRIDGPEVLFLHGGLLSHMCWERQVTDERLRGMRLVTYDLRGHGDSDRPLDPAAYREGARWAEDLRAVMDAAELRRPLVVGWSLGGVVLSAYLQRYGDERLAAVNWVSAIPSVEGLPPSAVDEVAPKMMSPHLPERIAALRAWLSACFETPPEHDVFERMLSCSSMALPWMSIVGPPIVPDPGPALRAFGRPALVTQGSADRITVPEVGRRLAADLPNATLSLYENVGHAVFLEAPERFTTELIGLLDRSR